MNSSIYNGYFITKIKIRFSCQLKYYIELCETTKAILDSFITTNNNKIQVFIYIGHLGAPNIICEMVYKSTNRYRGARVRSGDLAPPPLYWPGPILTGIERLFTGPGGVLKAYRESKPHAKTRSAVNDGAGSRNRVINPTSPPDRSGGERLRGPDGGRGLRSIPVVPREAAESARPSTRRTRSLTALCPGDTNRSTRGLIRDAEQTSPEIATRDMSIDRSFDSTACWPPVRNQSIVRRKPTRTRSAAHQIHQMTRAVWSKWGPRRRRPVRREGSRNHILVSLRRSAGDFVTRWPRDDLSATTEGRGNCSDPFLRALGYWHLTRLLTKLSFVTYGENIIIFVILM